MSTFAVELLLVEKGNFRAAAHSSYSSGKTIYFAPIVVCLYIAKNAADLNENQRRGRTHTSVPILLFLATAPIVIPVPVAAEMQRVTPASSASTATIPDPDGAVVFVGGMGGGTTGGGMTGK